jgi:hypothetical protein
MSDNMGDIEIMARRLSILVLMVAAISGCMEKGPGDAGPGGAQMSVDELKNLSIQSADDLSSYRLKSSVVQTTQFDAFRINVTPEFHGLQGRIMQIVWNPTIIKESTDTEALVNLSGHQARSHSSTTRAVQQAGRSEERSTGSRDLYLMGNSTYVRLNEGNWSHFTSLSSAETIWGQGRNSHVKILAEDINRSGVEIMGSERVDGVESYKLNISAGSSDYEEIYSMAASSANWLLRYPELMPFVDRAAIKKTAEIEKLVWISKDSYLPVKYQRRMSFRMTPEAVGNLDAETGKMRLFNKSVQLGEVSVELKSVDRYYEFNKSVEINLPKGAL